MIDEQHEREGLEKLSIPQRATLRYYYNDLLRSWGERVDSARIILVLLDEVEGKAAPAVKRIYATLNQDVTWADVWPNMGRKDLIAFRKGDKGLLTDLDHKQERKRAGVTFKDARLDYADRPEPEWIPMEFLDFSIEEEHEL